MNRLREVRVLKRITQFQLRLKTGIHQSKISMLENDLIMPGEDEQRRIAKVTTATTSFIEKAAKTSLTKTCYLVIICRQLSLLPVQIISAQPHKSLAKCHFS